MRVALFGLPGPLTLGVMSSLTSRHDVTLVVRGAGRGGGRLRSLLRPLARAAGLRRDPLLAAAREAGARYVRSESRADPRISEELARCAPELIVIASYPWIVPESVFGAAPLGAVNLHPSLLPRHRGALPYFWIYYHDDRESGVTAHRVTAEVDAGPILGRVATPVERGMPVDLLNEAKAQLAGPLALETLDRLASGSAPHRPQDEREATRAPLVPPGRAMVDFERWGAERVWHFLAGLFPRYREPLAERVGRPVRYHGVRAYSEAPHGEKPGTVRRSGDEWIVYCLDGCVHLLARRPRLP